jgi:hypothetical protein
VVNSGLILILKIESIFLRPLESNFQTKIKRHLLSQEELITVLGFTQLMNGKKYKMNYSSFLLYQKQIEFF